MAEILLWESNTRCYDQFYSSLWTSRFLVLNILVRRDLFSTERSNVQHQQDLRPRFLQLISQFFVFNAYRHIERTKKVNQFCKKLNSWVMNWFRSMTSRVCFVSFLTKLQLRFSYVRFQLDTTEVWGVHWTSCSAILGLKLKGKKNIPIISRWATNIRNSWSRSTWSQSINCAPLSSIPLYNWFNTKM